MPPRLAVRPAAFLDAAVQLDGHVRSIAVTALEHCAAAMTSCGAMAGSDPAGAAWAADYDASANRMLATALDLANGSHQLVRLLRQSGLNHAAAEAASVPGSVPASVPGSVHIEAATDLPVSYQVVPPPSATGGSGGGPPGWGLVQAFVAAVWPDGHQDRLHAAAQAWSDCAASFEGAARGVDYAVAMLADQASPEVDDATTVLIGHAYHYRQLAGGMRTLAGGCIALAHHIDEAHGQVVDELVELIEWTAAIEAAGAVASFFTFGLAQGPTQEVEGVRIAATAARISTILGRFAAAVRVAAEDVLTVEELCNSLAVTLERLLGARVAVAAVTGARALPGVARVTRFEMAEINADARLARGAAKAARSESGEITRAGRSGASIDRHAGRASRSIDGGVTGATGSLSNISQRFGYTVKQIRKAIHIVKNNARFSGNPDVVVDEAGEVYPLGRDGQAGDSIGNILEFLEHP